MSPATALARWLDGHTPDEPWSATMANPTEPAPAVGDIRTIIGRHGWCESCRKWVPWDETSAHRTAHLIVGDVWRDGRWRAH